MRKPNAEFLAFASCLIMKTFIQTSFFSTELMATLTSPIQEVDDSSENDDYRPVSILPVFSKVFNPWLNQIVDFIEKE